MLSIVATPIGNLGDITIRALETLKKCDAVICEDTRVTGKLFKQLEIPKKEFISMHGYSTPEKVDAIIRRLKAGEHLALVSDAGTPGISDPGFVLVSRLYAEGIPAEVLPGPSAFLAALSASGLAINQFTYLGFLPLKKGRKTLLESFMHEERTVVFYESVHRIDKALHEIAEVLRDQPERKIVVARELTKMHEQVVQTTIKDLPEISAQLMKKGEFVVILEGNR